MSWEEVAALDLSKAIAILPVGAIEAHGPHLPLGTDIIIAQAMARAGATRLDARGFEPVLLPPISYTAAPFASAFPGTIAADPDTVTALVISIAESLTGRFSALVIANAHLDPAHIASLRAAVDEIFKTVDIIPIFPDVTRRRWAAELTDEFRTGACHAGQYETSIVLACEPDLVDRSAMQQLPPVERSLSDAIREGLTSFAEAGGERAYFGAPADATAEEGHRTVEALGRIVESATLEALREM